MDQLLGDVRFDHRIAAMYGPDGIDQAFRGSALEEEGAGTGLEAPNAY